MPPTLNPRDLALQFHAMYAGGDRALLFGWLHAVLEERVPTVEACLRAEDASIERAHVDWSERLAVGRPTPPTLADTAPDVPSLLGLVLALAGIFADADPRCAVRVEQLPVVVPEGAAPLPTGHRFWILRRVPAPLLEGLPPSRHLARTNKDVGFDLAEELDLPVRILREPPSVRVRRIVLPAAVDQRLRDRGRPEQARVGLGLVRAAIRFSEVRAASSFKPAGARCVGYAAPADARVEMIRLAAAIAEAKLDVLLLPEMCMSDDLRRVLLDQLAACPAESRPAILVLGSGHVAEGPDFVNRAVAVDGKGRVLWRQDKCRPLRIPGPPEAVEEITCAEEVTLIDGYLGRMASPICLDFIHDDLLPIWVDGAVRLMLVPAYSPTLHDFQARAELLGKRAQTVTFVSNHRDLIAADKPGARGFAYVPVHAPRMGGDVPADDAPLFVFSIHVPIPKDTEATLK